MKKKIITIMGMSIITGLSQNIAKADTRVNVDEIYSVAYNATVKAQKTGEQKDINIARDTIMKLEGTGAAWAIGEFSKLVDKPQQIILTKIVDGIILQQEEGNPSQDKINELRDMIVILPTESWKNSYSTALDKPQQVLIDNAIVAADIAIENGEEGSINRANNLLDSLIGATNNEGVVIWATAYKLEFNKNNFEFKVLGAEILNSSKIKITFNRNILKETVDIKNIKISSEDDKDDKQVIKEIEVSEYERNIIITLEDALDVGKHNIIVTGVKDQTGAEVADNKITIEYNIPKISSISFKKNNIAHNTKKNNILDFLVIKDLEGRDITSKIHLSELEIKSNREDLVNSTTGMIVNEGEAVVTVSIKNTESTTGEVKLNIEKAKATTFNKAIFTNKEFKGLPNSVIDDIPDDIIVNNIKIGQKIYAYTSYKDQNGDEMPVSDAKIENEDIYAVGINGNIISGEQLGVVEIIFEENNIRGYKEIEVVSRSHINGMRVTEQKINLANPMERVQKSGEIYFVDQYNEKYNHSIGENGTFKLRYRAKYSNESDIEIMTDLPKVKYKGDAINGFIFDKFVDDFGVEIPEEEIYDLNTVEKIVKTAKIDLNPDTGEYTVHAIQEGDFDVFIRYEEGDLVYKTGFEVNSKGNKEIVRYEVGFLNGTDEKVDLYTDDKMVDLEVKGLNQNDSIVGELGELSATLEDSLGNKVVDNTVNIKQVNDLNLVSVDANNLIVGEYNLIIKNGKDMVKTMKIIVEDSKAVPTVVINNDISMNIGEIILKNSDKDLLFSEELLLELNKLIDFKDQYGNDITGNIVVESFVDSMLEVPYKNYYLDNVVKESSKNKSVDLIITGLKVNCGKNILGDEIFKDIKLAKNIRIKIEAK